MLVEELKLPEKVIDIIRNDIRHLNPPQAAAVKAGLLEGKNLVISSPTASGKTLIAEIAMLKNFLANKKTVYLSPLKALASEKYAEFTEKYKNLGMRIAISIGDYDTSDSWLERYDLIITSNEKMDSILRHNPKWTKDIGLIVADEIHLLNDASRGPTLEIVLTRLRQTTKAQTVALSATIQNAKEVAKWLDAKLVKSDYRPVKLERGISYSENERVLIFLGKKKEILDEPEIEKAVTLDTLGKKKQALLFVSTRPNAEAAAERLGEVVKKFLKPEEKKELLKISDGVENALSSPTRQCRRLAAMVKNGIAFHHAGLVAKQRKLIEDNFRSGIIKILVSTPTLSFGMNMPAWRVLIRDTKRFAGYGSDYIPVLEVHQMFGRAGRPKYDTEGQAILMAKSKNEAKELYERYINGEPEPIYSKLSVEPELRMHVLALIASEHVKSRKELEEFFSRTFFAHQYGDISEVMKKVEKMMKQLQDFGFIRAEKSSFISKDFVPAFDLMADDKISATPVGKRVSELYIDPVSANIIITNMDSRSDEDMMMVMNECIEMRPLLGVKKKDMEFIEDEVVKSKIENIPDVWDVDYEDFIMSFKTYLFFRDWMEEAGEDALLEKYGIAPGELYNKKSNAEWLYYSASELAKLLRKRNAANNINRLMLRIKHGVREELLQLVMLRGIGRARARKLWNSGIKSTSDVKKASEEIIGKIIGPGIAKQLKQELENRF
jgi:helicase